jgi:hypothetical protein
MASKLKTTLTTGAIPLLLVISSPALGLGSTPVLGGKHAFRSGAGFGTVKPSHVFLGGDPTGNVTSIAWRNWGSQRSIGSGTGWCPGRSVAAGHPCPASLHAYALGTCHRRRAYTEMAFYFKSHPRSHWKLGSKWNICTGTPT